VLDLGETLVDETANSTSWAQWLGVPPLTFFAVLPVDAIATSDLRLESLAELPDALQLVAAPTSVLAD
jgi:hypothetical protein